MEEKYHITVFDCFEKYGEEAFRKLEYNILLEVLQKENVVIATGGGTPCFFDAMRLINEAAFSIYIDMSPKALTHRLLHTKTPRHFSKDKTEEELYYFVTEQLALRKPFYQQAHITLKGENVDISELISVLKPLL